MFTSEEGKDMSRFTRLLIIFIVLLLAAPVLPGAAQDGGLHGRRPDAPPYAVHGPYAVGTQVVTIDADGEQPIEVVVWYPALNPDNKEEAFAYPIVMSPDLTIYISGHALENAAPDKSDAPYPLVIFSHGFGTVSRTYAYLNEHLASYGFVVMGPLHTEVWEPTFSDMWGSTVERPMDIQKVIAYAETQAGPGGDMQGLFDPENVGVAGHSYGGFTALAAGGAPLNTKTFTTDCEGVAEGSQTLPICPVIGPHLEEMADVAGLDGLPDGVWPAWDNPQVKAVVSLAAVGYLFQAADLKDVSVPLLAMVGTADWVGQDQTDFIYENVSSMEKALVTFKEANHFVFQWRCADIPALVDMGFYGVCSDPVWDMDRAYDLTDHFVTAFFLATLKGDTDAEAALAPDAVFFPGVAYEAEGF
jgi:predicted dienelactone hydrolase